MNHRPRKRFGQNFLHDTGVIRRIISCIAPRAGDRLVEIGPGLGAITRELLSAVGSMDAVELDRDLIAPLARMCAPLGDLRIHNLDALGFDFCSLAGPEGALRVVGNLPYNISTPILFHLLDQAHCIADMHFMLQREVVQRMGAEPGCKAYGRLSVMLQARCEVIPLFDIGPDAFTPAPKVDSALVRLVPHRTARYRIDDYPLFRRLVAAAFSQRRKTLRNALADLMTEAEIRHAGQTPGARAEQLSVAAFAALANAAACKNGTAS
ncbi:MAG: 16S rRNA (adenine(1518)-N(6)/adenine(1519)-N(6))-dimethyltransferase RsmA [Gammaproteobacteria bacterium]|nr:16S rRNA (adenine(1518)-N(6)/adenine(1519)-N(6))-dimethyltransferase RsmA [Gammaproteobacteria bacterium]